METLHAIFSSCLHDDRAWVRLGRWIPGVAQETIDREDEEALLRAAAAAKERRSATNIKDEILPSSPSSSSSSSSSLRSSPPLSSSKTKGGPCSESAGLTLRSFAINKMRAIQSQSRQRRRKKKKKEEEEEIRERVKDEGSNEKTIGKKKRSFYSSSQTRELAKAALGNSDMPVLRESADAIAHMMGGLIYITYET